MLAIVRCIKINCKLQNSSKTSQVSCVVTAFHWFNQSAIVLKNSEYSKELSMLKMQKDCCISAGERRNNGRIPVPVWHETEAPSGYLNTAGKIRHHNFGNDAAMQ